MKLPRAIRNTITEMRRLRTSDVEMKSTPDLLLIPEGMICPARSVLRGTPLRNEYALEYALDADHARAVA